MLTLFIIVVCLVIGGATYMVIQEDKHVSALPAAEKAEYLAKRSAQHESNHYGPINHELVCPHCQTKGKVRVRNDVRKVGVSGGKATGALLTGGVSLLATGLSRKEKGMKAFCSNCKLGWSF